MEVCSSYLQTRMQKTIKAAIATQKNNYNKIKYQNTLMYNPHTR